MLDCLTNIIGLSDTECDCWDDTKPMDFAELNASSSGLYVLNSDSLPINMANAGSDCSNGSIWDIAIDAREKAIKQTLTDFLNGVNTRLDQRFAPFKTIGDDYYKTAEFVQNTANYAGFYIEPYRIKGGAITVNSVDINFFSGITAPTNVTIEVYNSRDFTNVLTSATVSVTGNKEVFTATFPTPFVIDLTNSRPDKNERFYFVYQIPVGAKPINNNIKQGCGCGSRNEYQDDPFLMVLNNQGGVQSDTILDLENGYFTSTMQGLRLNAVFSCDYYSWLCELAQDPNTPTFGGRLNLGWALADCIKAWSIMSVADTILKSKRIGYYTMVLDPQVLVSEIQRQKQIYDDGIDNLVYHMPKDVSDCLVCKDRTFINKNSIKI